MHKNGAKTPLLNMGRLVQSIPLYRPSFSIEVTQAGCRTIKKNGLSGSVWTYKCIIAERNQPSKEFAMVIYTTVKGCLLLCIHMLVPELLKKESSPRSSEMHAMTIWFTVAGILQPFFFSAVECISSSHFGWRQDRMRVPWPAHWAQA